MDSTGCMTSHLAKETIGVVGLGYVGLPLACAFARHGKVIGFDVNARRVSELVRGQDRTGEMASAELRQKNLSFVTQPRELQKCQVIIVAVPTPVNDSKLPDLDPVRKAARLVGQNLRKGMLIVFESTVYPGVTEEICLPILESESKLKLGQFSLGYSPERINPGDAEHSLASVIKVVSGHNAKVATRVAELYRRVACAGVHVAPNIKTAEAAKVIENIQRDLNIALMNELSMIFSKMGIPTKDVLDAAATKWNFHRYHPGLVGGHCIGVDPYYLTYRALQLGIHPRVILSGRSVNDEMGRHVGETILKMLIDAKKSLKKSRVVMMGLTFKENVRDTRNSRVMDTIRYLKEFGVEVLGCDPMLGSKVEMEGEIITNLPFERVNKMDAVVLVNRHRAFEKIRLEELRKKMRTPILLDLKNLFNPDQARRAGLIYRAL